MNSMTVYLSIVDGLGSSLIFMLTCEWKIKAFVSDLTNDRGLLFKSVLVLTVVIANSLWRIASNRWNTCLKNEIEINNTINNFNQFKNLIEMDVFLCHRCYIIEGINVTPRVPILAYSFNVLSNFNKFFFSLLIYLWFVIFNVFIIIFDRINWIV